MYGRPAEVVCFTVSAPFKPPAIVGVVFGGEGMVRVEGFCSALLCGYVKRRRYDLSCRLCILSGKWQSLDRG